MPAICEHCHGSGRKVDHKAIGQFFRSRRIAKHIGLRQMAKQVNVCPGYLSRLERGLALWHLNLMDKMNQILS